MNSYLSFAAAIRERESNNDYTIKNQYNYLGAYQFGMARLCDFNLAERIDKESVSCSNKYFKFITPLTEEKFLNSETIQDIVFYWHVIEYKELIELRDKEHLNSLHAKSNCFIDMSGCIAVCHLLGYGGLLKLLYKGWDDADGNGTLASDYMKKFNGYDLS